MKKIKEKYIIKNYHGFISLPTEDINKPIFIESGNFNTMKASTKRVTLEQIRHINIMSDVFKIGRVEFEKEDREELFEELVITTEEGYFTAQDIMDTVKNPTKDKLEKVIKIQNLNTIDLFRGIITSYKNLGSEDVSNRVMIVINKRRDEIYKSPGKESLITVKKTTTEIEFEKKDEILKTAMENKVAEMEAEFAIRLKEEIKKATDKVKKDLKKKDNSKKTESKK